jgi:hypothetical protein
LNLKENDRSTPPVPSKLCVSVMSEHRTKSFFGVPALLGLPRAAMDGYLTRHFAALDEKRAGA